MDGKIFVASATTPLTIKVELDPAPAGAV